MPENHEQQVVRTETELLRATSLREYLDDFAVRAGRHLGVDTEVCITLRHGGTNRLAASSSERAAHCDEVEYAAGAGPCLTAMESMRVVLVPDIAADDRWPQWAEASLAEGFASSAGVPAHVADDVEIVLNLYSENVDAWQGSVLPRADTYAQQVALTVGLCLQVAQLGTAHTRALDAVAERELVIRLLVAAVTDNEDTAAELLRRLHGVVRTRSTDPEADVRALIQDVSETRAETAS